MRILTVRQPWAWAIIHGGKDIENRVRNVAGGYRGPVAIHVARADAEAAPESLWLQHSDWYRARTAQPKKFDPAWSDRGHIIGVVDLADVHDSAKCYDESIQHAVDLYRTDREAFDALPVRNGAGGLIARGGYCSEWAQDEAHHLVLANPRALPEPIPYTGALGLRGLDDDTIARINEGLS
ncbi:hypothetical protein [Microbacterium sp. JAI119]|uniref:hypothetical protein n=1 Tax=Microbacterium sp. JAI119 TaxID=2723062 RepID=UPI0015C89E0B|nr:hypothetical protein [Microbacterium sp. JAI119]NYF29053.1 hypothetical protein [Microbacterium sp. JAI119]